MKKQEIACNNKRLHRFGPFILDVEERRLLQDGKTIPLIHKLFDLLVVLVESSGHLKTREELMAALWPHVTVEEQSLTAKVYALRKKLGDEGDVPRYIETVRGIGYRFIAPVTHDKPAAGEVNPTGIHPARAPLRFGAGASTVALLAALSAAGIVYQVSVPHEHAQASPVHPTIAVLPFESMGANETYGFFAAGIQDTILARLAKVGGVRVISDMSSASNPGRANKPRATAVLRGSVQHSGDRVLINVQLIDARSDTQLWAATYVRTLEDVFGVENDVAGQVAAALDQEVGPGEIRPGQ